MPGKITRPEEPFSRFIKISCKCFNYFGCKRSLYHSCLRLSRHDIFRLTDFKYDERWDNDTPIKSVKSMVCDSRRANM